VNTLTFTIRLLEPALVTQLGGGDPNSSRSYPFIPGSVVRGFLVGRYLQGSQVDAGDTDFRRLFFDGKVRFLNAYPLDRRGERTLPTPQSWFAEKGETDPIFDFAVRENEKLETPKGIKEPFCRPYLSEEDDTWQVKVEFYEPPIQVNIHTYREERARVVKEKSTVFRYEAIAAGEQFGGVILADDVSDLRTLRSLLANAEFDIGGSHTAGYGHVRIEEIGIGGEWAEYNSVGGEAEDIIVTLLSDTVLRDANGTCTTDLDRLVGEKHKQAYVRTRIGGGFNRKWGLPLPQTLAIQAGSVYVYPHSDDLLARLRTLEVTSIGERRVEGFGRIAVNWHQVPQLKPQSRLQEERPLPVQLQGDSAELAQRMTERMLRAELDRALVRNVNRLEIRPYPSNSQLSRMRLVARRALAGNDAGVITKHLDGMKKMARAQFDRAKIGGQRLSEWLIERASNPQTIWDELQIGGVKKPSIGGVQPDFSEALALEYTVRLIDGVLRKATKKEGER